MTNSATSSQAAIKKILRAILGFSAGLTLLVGLCGIWLFASTAGARFSLSLLEHSTGIQSRGVSGSLAKGLHVQHLTLNGKQLEFIADEVDVQWQPSKLFQRQIQLDNVQVGNVELALAPGDGQPATLPRSLQLPARIRLLQIDRLSVAQFQLATLEPEHEHRNAQRFSSLHAALTINASTIALKTDGNTPWGNAIIEGSVTVSAPFAILANIRWQGLSVRQDKITLPETSLTGNLSGNLSKMLLQAQLNTDESKTGSDVAAGKIDVVLTPFATLPVDTLQLDLTSVNPASFYQDAPRARLNLKADFKAHGDANSPTLSGQFSVINKIPATWNSGGIPIAQASSDLTVSEQAISWKDSKIDMGQGGVAVGYGALNLHSVPGTAQSVLPDLSAQFDLSRVNLIGIDNRLKKTNLAGKVQVSNKSRALHFILNLRESNPALNAQLLAEINLGEDLKLDVQQMELKAKEAIFAAHGSITLDNRQEFKLAGEMQNFNPARWLAVPQGQIALRFNLAGQLQHGQNWQIDAQVPYLNGKFAGLDLHGESDFQLRLNELLSIQKLNFDWGKNHMSASGNWQMGAQQHAGMHEKLQVSVAIPDLEAVSRPFEKFLPTPMQGSVYADGVLSGNATRPSGQLTVTASQLAVPGKIYLDRLQADLLLDEGAQGKFTGKLNASGLSTAKPDKTRIDDGRWQVQALQAEIEGLRHEHTIQLTATLPQQQQFALQARGNLLEPQSGAGQVATWKGQISALNLSGPLDFQLRAPIALTLSSQSAHMSEANWEGNLGRLHVQQIDWASGQLETSGQFQEISLVRALKFWRADLPVSGDLQLDADWQTHTGSQISGQLQIRRTKGDLLLQYLSGGHGRSIPLGMKKLLLTANLPDGDHTHNQPLALHLQAQGDRLGLFEAELSSSMNKDGQQWELQKGAPLSGKANLQIKDLSWMSHLLGEGINLHGALDAKAELSGTAAEPVYRAAISSHDLQIALTELGIVLPNGQLDAVIEENQLRLNSLNFSDSIKQPPRHEQLADLNWLSETGKLETSGSVNLRTGQGTLSTHWDKFPFMQSPTAWLVASGQAQLAQTGKTWNLTGKLNADAAYFSVPKQAAPRLSGDVMVLNKNEKRTAERASGLRTGLDFSISAGNHFIFVGRGIDTRLDGEIRIRSKNGGPIISTGNIQTVGGTYEGYGQKLQIDRGILNFQGPIDNPGLNVRAIRRGLAVEAGVEVIGTVDKPEVRLISEPNVPDPDKLSWMVLGRASDQMAGSEAGLLMSAAGAIFGGDGGSSSKIPSSISRSFGLDSLSFGTTTTAPGTQLPAQTVAGTINSAAPGDQVFSVGKRIAPDLVFSIERSLTDASNGMKLTWKLTRQFSIIGRAGSDNAVDGQYIFSFD